MIFPIVYKWSNDIEDNKIHSRFATSFDRCLKFLQIAPDCEISLPATGALYVHMCVHVYRCAAQCRHVRHRE